MIALIQRVTSASVTVAEQRIAEIEQGLLVLLAVEKKDDGEIAEKMAEKLLNYRIFADTQDKMNLSVSDISGSVLLVPQFTLAAETQKGLRPGFSNAAKPEKGLELFSQLVDIMREKGRFMAHDWLQTGQFGADMAVELVNDGPVTFYLSL